MKSRSRVFNTTSLIPVILLGAACVTVNVNFPESAVQQAADDYVKELYEAQEQETTKKGSTGAWLLDALRGLFISDAHAEVEISFKVKTPAAVEIQGRQKKRISKLNKFKKQGFVGENNQGLLEFRKGPGLSKLKKKAVQKLVRKENSDRNALFSEIVSSNNLTDANRPVVIRSFAKSFQSHSPKGTWVQDQSGKWSKR